MSTGAARKAWLKRNPTYYRDYYRNNKDRIKQQRDNDKYKAAQKLRAKKVRNRARRVIDTVKLANGCLHPECKWAGDFQACCLDFHHLGTSTKQYCLALMLTRPIDAIKAEMRKCTILCTNCHRLVTHGLIDVSKLSACNV